MGDRPRGHDLRVREEEAEPEGLRGRVVQVQHVAVAADDGEDRVSIRKYSHRLCTSCESSVVVVVVDDVDTNVVDVFIDDLVAAAAVFVFEDVVIAIDNVVIAVVIVVVIVHAVAA